MLNSRWIIAACFACELAPIEEIIAVTQVPMFCPSAMNTALFQVTMPFIASV